MRQSKNQMPLANLFVLSAPSGAGKTSLVKALLKSMDNLCVSVSHTTRPRRPNEIEGINYYFVSEKEFQSLIASNAFLEYARVFQQSYYGTSRAFVMNKLAQGIDVILEIDWQGAAQIKKLFPQAIEIFILPPSQATLMKRLQNRAMDDENTIKQRMSSAKNEISHYAEFDYIVINDQFEDALNDLETIIKAQRLSRQYQEKRHADLIEKLCNSCSG